MSDDHTPWSALIIDLDGVLRHWDPEVIAATERRYDMRPGAILGTAFDPGRLDAVITGRISDDAWRADIAEALADTYGGIADQAVREWSDYRGDVDADVLALVRRARRTMPVSVLSNATSRLHEDLRFLGIHDEFDLVLSSADLGVAKPDPRVFALACARIGRQPQECLFVDDQAANVDSATAAGLIAHRFHDAAELSSRLARPG